jgi:hypothetical protein
LGQQSLVCALSSSTPAMRQLVVLLEHCGKVQEAAAGQQKEQQQESQVRLLQYLAWAWSAYSGLWSGSGL